MNPNKPSWMTDEIALFEDSVTKFLQKEYLPNSEKWEEAHQVDRNFWKKAAEIGLLSATIPEEYGGIGQSFAYESVIFSELGRMGISGFGIHVHLITAHYILKYGTEDQKKIWLPKLCEGELVGAIAMTEPCAGSDLQGIETTAVRKDDGYLINGSKTFISNGLTADLIMVVAKTDPKLGAKGISLFMVETENLKGFSRGKPLKKIGQHAQDTAELFFDDVYVSTDTLLGEKAGQGFYQMMDQLAYERLIVAIHGVGYMELAVDITAEYTKQRQAFGNPLIKLQNTRFKLAEAKTESTIARVFIDHCVQQFMDGKLDASTASMAKWWVTQKQCEVVDECLQLHGGYGYSLEYPIAKMFVDSRVQKIYAGSNEVMKELIARSL